MAKEIQLINQVEQYEYLYNFNLLEYNRKDMADEAWATIAAKVNMSIADCKEKWRNMRTTFLRSMKPSSKVRRPYYLSEHLKFVIPFLKPASKGIESPDDSQSDSQSNTATIKTEVTSTSAALSNTVTKETEVDNLTCVSSVFEIKEEATEVENEEHNQNHADNGILSNPLARKSTALRKRRRFLPIKKKHADSLRNRRKGATSNFSSRPDSIGADNKAIRLFLMSLIPELEVMTEEQFRLFKIKAMMLIDEIKVN